LAFLADGSSSLYRQPERFLADAEAADRPQPRPYAILARQLGERVLARNIFDSQTGPLSWEPPAEPTAAAAEPPPMVAASAGPPPNCPASLRLVASMVNARHPERSLAALRKDGKTHLLAPGGRLDDLTLFALRSERAYLAAADGALCTLPVFLAASERPPSEPKLPAAPPPRAADKDAKPKPKSRVLFSKEELDHGVVPLGRGGYAITRQLVLRALADPGGAAAGAQFRPVEHDGQVVGMELRAVRSGSPLKYMGLQSGDVVRSLNGADLTTPVGLLSALRAVRESDTVSISITRDNAHQTIQYLLD
jgi:general secretion pathway protein C